MAQLHLMQKRSNTRRRLNTSLRGTIKKLINLFAIHSATFSNRSEDSALSVMLVANQGAHHARHLLGLGYWVTWLIPEGYRMNLSSRRLARQSVRAALANPLCQQAQPLQLLIQPLPLPMPPPSLMPPSPSPKQTTPRPPKDWNAAALYPADDEPVQPTRPHRFETEFPRGVRSPCPRDVSPGPARDRAGHRLEPLGTIRFRTASTPGSCAASTARTTTYPWDARRRHRARALRRRRSAPPSHPARGLLSRATTEADANARSGKRRRFYFFSRLLSDVRDGRFRPHFCAHARGDVRPRHRGAASSSRDLRKNRHPERNPRVGGLGLGQAGEPVAPRRSSRLRRRGRVANRPVAPGGEAPRARRRDAHRVQLRERLARRRLGQAVRATGFERGRARGATNRACAATVRGARRRRVREARERANRLLTTPISTLDTRLLH